MGCKSYFQDCDKLFFKNILEVMEAVSLIVIMVLDQQMIFFPKEEFIATQVTRTNLPQQFLSLKESKDPDSSVESKKKGFNLNHPQIKS